MKWGYYSVAGVIIVTVWMIGTIGFENYIDSTRKVEIPRVILTPSTTTTTITYSEDIFINQPSIITQMETKDQATHLLEEAALTTAEADVFPNIKPDCKYCVVKYSPGGWIPAFLHTAIKINNNKSKLMQRVQSLRII